MVFSLPHPATIYSAILFRFLAASDTDLSVLELLECHCESGLVSFDCVDVGCAAPHSAGCGSDLAIRLVFTQSKTTTAMFACIQLRGDCELILAA